MAALREFFAGTDDVRQNLQESPRINDVNHDYDNIHITSISQQYDAAPILRPNANLTCDTFNQA